MIASTSGEAFLCRVAASSHPNVYCLYRNLPISAEPKSHLMRNSIKFSCTCNCCVFPSNYLQCIFIPSCSGVIEPRHSGILTKPQWRLQCLGHESPAVDVGRDAERLKAQEACHSRTHLGFEPSQWSLG